MPTDIELESLAQTWSEHCKHTIFAAALDEVEDGLYATYIKGATAAIRAAKGKDDFCVSVFRDNSGAIAFDDEYLVTDKVETHNSPSALDPFGGAVTGVVGVNRDAIGCGLGAKPIANRYGFCLAPPDDPRLLFRDKACTEPLLSPRRIMDGVIEGVNVGGNCSGVPTPQGFVCFDPRYRGKPLVFAGTVGLMPRTSAGRPSHLKAARPGDVIVMVGGRVGRDGIHGATFSSEALSSGSPATAVQIGDPITQKKFSDAIIKEARDAGLYNSITDNGAGGLSCSVAEMARECGGCVVELDRVPLKYPGLEPWQIWISESQERMTLAVPPDKLDAFTDLMARRGVEAAAIGCFEASGRCRVRWHGAVIMDVDLDFLHDGLPRAQLRLHQPPRRRRQQPRQPLGRGMCPVRRRKCIIHIDLPQGRQLRRKLGIVLLFPRMEAGVLQQNHLASPRLRDGRGRGITHAIGGKHHLSPQRPGQRICDMPKAHLRHHLALRPVEMRQQNHLAALRHDVVDRRPDLVDPGHVRHPASLHRHVDVDPHQHHFPVQVHVVERFPGHRHLHL